MSANRLLTFILPILCACNGGSGADDSPYKRINAETLIVRNSPLIKTIHLEMGLLPTGIDLSGRVVIPDKNLFILSARVQGRIETISVTTGDPVRKGQDLVHLWSPDFVTAAEELKIADSQKDKSISELTHQKLEAMGLDPADLAATTNSFILRSPLSGAVLERKLNAVSAVQPGDAILTIGKLDSYQFQGELAPEQLVRVRSGMPVRFEDYPEVHAEVESVSSVADQVSRLMKVRCRFKAAPPRTLPQETFLKAQIITSNLPALTAPAKALVFSKGEEFVFVKKSESKDGQIFERIKVIPNMRTKAQIALPITEQIKAGSEIVSEGALLLNGLLDDNG